MKDWYWKNTRYMNKFLKLLALITDNVAKFYTSNKATFRWLVLDIFCLIRVLGAIYHENPLTGYYICDILFIIILVLDLGMGISKVKEWMQINQ